ncbi:hypothetical protein C4K04_4679 [Pseudomonas chlororaphis]|uniref:Uncharacterized protein n=1 Tax=Pseudomonas chlororaphis TaxID=587753 RepID=A0A3G7TT70_9PSED|nr:hypothetical protein C4K04_4679 [Pseudomonas chlororaphis]
MESSSSAHPRYMEIGVEISHAVILCYMSFNVLIFILYFSHRVIAYV